MPRVLVDISPVGASSESRTGLARVALSLARALAAEPDVALHTCAFGSLLATDAFETVRREFPELHGIAAQRGWLERAYMAMYRRGDQGLPPFLWRIVGQAVNLVRDPLAGISFDAFDVIHSTYARFPRRVTRTSLPTVVTLHDLIPLQMSAESFKPGEVGVTRRIVDGARTASWVACVSESTRQNFLDYTGFPLERTVVIPNGVDHNVFLPLSEQSAIAEVRRRFGIGNLPFVLTLSSLAAHKNLGMLVDAWAHYSGASEGILVVAGGRTTEPGPLMRALGVDAHCRGVTLTGFVTDDEFRALASSCQAFLFPSLFEGFGLPVLEAMACGAPVICSNTTSLPEVVGEAGLLLDPTDTDAWTDAIAVALERPLRTAPHHASVDRAARFSWADAANSYVALYRKAMS